MGISSLVNLFRKLRIAASSDEEDLGIQQTRIEDLPTEIFHDNVFTYLSQRDLDTVSRVSKRFRQLSWDFQSLRVRVLRLAFPDGDTVPASRIRLPQETDSHGNFSCFLVRLERRITEMNQVLPPQYQSPYSPEGMALRVPADLAHQFFHNACQFASKQCFGDLAGVPETDGLEESAKQIQRWLTSDDKSQYIELNLRNRHLVCIPAEICLFSNLEKLDVGDNVIDRFPAEMGKLSKLRSIEIDGNPVTRYPSEFSKLDGTPAQGLSWKGGGIRVDSSRVVMVKFIALCVLGQVSIYTIENADRFFPQMRGVDLIVPAAIPLMGLLLLTARGILRL